ncbi:MAG: DUF4179 domain-containing protein [Eubacteriales bacterium]|nr:DUF4179 domain-containing protein [Eubacteriales bacterium]
MNQGFQFLELFSEIDDQYIYHASRPWEEQHATFETIRTNRLKIIAACTFLVLMLSLTAIYHKEVQAAWNHFTTMIGKILGIHDNVMSYTDIVGKSVTKNGITITLEEAAMDGKELWLAYSCAAEKPETTMPVLLTEVRVNQTETQLNGTWNFTAEQTSAANFRNEMVSRFCLETTIDKTDLANIEIKVQTMNPDTEEITDEYPFTFTASPKELEADTTEIPLNEEIRIDDERCLKLTGFRLNIFDSAIYGSLDSLKDDEEYFLIGEDNLGNPVRYTMGSYGNPEITFRLDTMDSLYSRISPKAEYLSLRLYVLKPENAKPPASQKYSSSGEPDTYIEAEGRIYEENEQPTDGAVPIGDTFIITVQ